jgi:hypothetical protein
MNDDNDYKVEKDRFSVTLFLFDGSVKDGYVYLSFHAANHEGPETVTDVLNQKEQFLPINFDDGSIRLINKDKIVMISFRVGEQKTRTLSLGDLSIHDVTIHLMNQGCLEGRFISLLPTYSRRLKDYLNRGDLFLELRRDGNTYLIHRDHVLFVEEK